MAARLTRRAALIAAVLGDTGMAACAQTAGRLPLQHDLELRPEHGTEGFPYLFHRPSGLWVGQDIQLAVPAARPLPDPLAPPKREAFLQVLWFGGLTIESASITGGVANRQVQQTPTAGPWYWWWIKKAIGDPELRRTQRLGVQIAWPQDDINGSARRYEPMEVFELPPIDAQPPGQWTPFKRADDVVAGEDAQFTVVKRKSSTSAHAELPEFPFELRARAQLWETPYRPKK
jgi:hypothetical protein